MNSEKAIGVAVLMMIAIILLFSWGSMHMAISNLVIAQPTEAILVMLDNTFNIWYGFIWLMIIAGALMILLSG